MIETKAPMKFAPFDQLCIYLGNFQEIAWKQFREPLGEYNLQLLHPSDADWQHLLPLVWNKEEYRDQLAWEQEAMKVADVIVQNVDLPGNLTTLFDLGKYSHSGKIVVYSPVRHKYVEHICLLHGIPFIDSFRDLVSFVLSVVKYGMAVAPRSKGKLDLGEVFHQKYPEHTRGG